MASTATRGTGRSTGVGYLGPRHDESFGYTLMTEQSGPRELVRYAVAAEQAGFDFEVSSDHYSPWLTEQGHAPYAWTTLGAVAQATSRVGPDDLRDLPDDALPPGGGRAEGRDPADPRRGPVHPRARQRREPQRARRRRGLAGDPGPAGDARARRSSIIRALHTGELVDHRGEHFQVDSARIWDLPEQGVEIGLAVAGDRAIERFAPLGDHLIAVEPTRPSVDAWNAVDGAPRIGEQARAIGPDPDLLGPRRGHRGQARARAVPLVRRRLAGQRRPADPGGLRRRDPVRAARGRRGVDPLRTRPRPDRRGGLARTGRPGSPTSRSCRSATRGRTGSSTRRPGRCWRSCARQPPSETRQLPAWSAASHW